MRGQAAPQQLSLNSLRSACTDLVTVIRELNSLIGLCIKNVFTMAIKVKAVERNVAFGEIGAFPPSRNGQIRSVLELILV